MSGFHLEVLPPAQQEVLRQLAPFAAREGFHLAGGTALALRLGHRQSIDFDWFRRQPIAEPLQLAAELRGAVTAAGDVETARGTLHASVAGVKVSFFEYPYPLLLPLQTWEPFGCPLASLEDLASMKVAAVSQRGARKDFIDLYALLQAGLALPELLALYRRRFQVQEVGHVLASLTYFDDAEQEPMPVMLRDWRWDQVKAALQREVRTLMG